MFENMGLGRLLKPDPRDHDHLMAAARVQTAGVPEFLTAAQQKYLKLGRRRHNPKPNGLGTWDQVGTSRCCSFGGNRWLVCEPVQNLPWVPPGHEQDLRDNETELSLRLDDFYDRIRDVDGFPIPHEGSTVRAVFKVLAAAGLVGGYQWAFTAEAVCRHILTWGPVVAGVDWTTPMFSPSIFPKFKNAAYASVLTDTGNYNVEGGHCVCIYACDVNATNPDETKGWVEFINSWGDSWGWQGTARISLRDLGILANNQGEFATGVEVHRRLPRIRKAA